MVFNNFTQTSLTNELRTSHLQMLKHTHRNRVYSCSSDSYFADRHEDHTHTHTHMRTHTHAHTGSALRAGTVIYMYRMWQRNVPLSFTATADHMTINKKSDLQSEPSALNFILFIQLQIKIKVSWERCICQSKNPVILQRNFNISEGCRCCRPCES